MFRESIEGLIEGNGRVTIVMMITVLSSKLLVIMVTVLHEAPRADAARARNASAHAAAVACLFAQPGNSTVPQPLRPER